MTVSAYAVPGRIIHKPNNPTNGITYGNGTPINTPTTTTLRYPTITITPTQVQQILNYRFTDSSNDAAAWGAKQAKTDILGILGLGKTFNGQNVHDTSNISSYYTPQKPNNTGEITFSTVYGGLYNLRNRTGYFLNNTIWGMDHTYRNITQYNETKILYTRSTNHSSYTYWRTYNTSYQNWELTDDWFVYRR